MHDDAWLWATGPLALPRPTMATVARPYSVLVLKYRLPVPWTMLFKIWNITLYIFGHHGADAPPHTPLPTYLETKVRYALWCDVFYALWSDMLQPTTIDALPLAPLPHECIAAILAQVAIRDICAAEQCCTSWRRVASDRGLWRVPTHLACKAKRPLAIPPRCRTHPWRGRDWRAALAVALAL